MRMAITTDPMANHATACEAASVTSASVDTGRAAAMASISRHVEVEFLLCMLTRHRPRVGPVSVSVITGGRGTPSLSKEYPCVAHRACRRSVSGVCTEALSSEDKGVGAGEEGES